MEYPNGEDEFQDASDDSYDWIEKIKTTGATPYLELDGSSRNGWSTPSSAKFMVRGPNYFSDKKKVASSDYLLKPLGFDWIKGPTKISEVLKNPNHRIRKTLSKMYSTDTNPNTKPFIWAFNLQLPGKDNYSAILYFASLNRVENGSSIDRFLKSDDSFKKSRLKLIANIIKAPWIVRTAVGEHAICILGKALNCKYVNGSDFFEVDVDIGSSIVANAVVHLALGYVKSLTIDLGFLIEGQTEDELPERVLGAIRFVELDPASAQVYEMNYEENKNNTGTGFWKNFGFLHHNNSNETENSSDSGSGSIRVSGLDSGLKSVVNGDLDRTDGSGESNGSVKSAKSKW